MGDLKPVVSPTTLAPPPLPPPPPPPPPPLFPGSSSARTPVLPQQQTPRPRSQMKHLPWNKIPSTKVVGTTNLWSELGQTFDGYQMDFNQIEALFAVQQQQQQRASDDVTSHVGNYVDGLPDESANNRKKMEVVCH